MMLAGAGVGGGSGSEHNLTCDGASGGPRAGPCALILVLHGGVIHRPRCSQHNRPVDREVDRLCRHRLHHPNVAR